MRKLQLVSRFQLTELVEVKTGTRIEVNQNLEGFIIIIHRFQSMNKVKTLNHRMLNRLEIT